MGQGPLGAIITNPGGSFVLLCDLPPQTPSTALLRQVKPPCKDLVTEEGEVVVRGRG